MSRIRAPLAFASVSIDATWDTCVVFPRPSIHLLQHPSRCGRRHLEHLLCDMSVSTVLSEHWKNIGNDAVIMFVNYIHVLRDVLWDVHKFWTTCVRHHVGQHGSLCLMWLLMFVVFIWVAMVLYCMWRWMVATLWLTSFTSSVTSTIRCAGNGYVKHFHIIDNVICPTLCTLHVYSNICSTVIQGGHWSQFWTQRVHSTMDILTCVHLTLVARKKNNVFGTYCQQNAHLA